MIQLTRNAFIPSMGTFGEVMVQGQRFYTVERPWLDNEPMVSCVPEGVYQVTTHPTTTPVPHSFNGRTWYLEGGSVGLDFGLRTRIAIHIGNTASDLAGCIAFGLGLGCVSRAGEGTKWAVTRSTDALVALRRLLPESFELEIVRMV